MMKSPAADVTRRQLLLAGGAAALGGATRVGAAGSWPPPNPIDEGAVAGEKISFPAIQADTERPGGGPPNGAPPAARVGFAIMGLGRLALENILPAFAQTKHARCVALISGDAQKMRAIAQQYGISPDACYGYEDVAKLRSHRAVEVVYVVLPNSLHRDAVLSCAAAGKHVLCEKPMATSPEDARAMVEACRNADRQLMIAYRCQYEIYNRELARRARAGELGRIQVIDAINTQNQSDTSQWRHKKALAGGGALPDIGLYCLNTSRALLGEEPLEVSAHVFSPDDARFKEVEATVAFTLKFPSGIIANCLTSYAAHEHRSLKVFGDKATGEIASAFGYSGQRLKIYQREGPADASSEFSLPDHNQFALEIDHMAQCARHNVKPRTPGEEGLQDQLLMAAIYESARTGRPVKMAPVEGTDLFRGPPPTG
jgi:predicted dehydrogenase